MKERLDKMIICIKCRRKFELVIEDYKINVRGLDKSIENLRMYRCKKGCTTIYPQGSISRIRFYRRHISESFSSPEIDDECGI